MCVRGEGVDRGRERDIGCADGARGSADGALVEGGDKGRERDIGCADGARWRAWESCGLPFCQYSLRLGFRVPGLTLFGLVFFPHTPLPVALCSDLSRPPITPILYIHRILGPQALKP